MHVRLLWADGRIQDLSDPVDPTTTVITHQDDFVDALNTDFGARSKDMSRFTDIVAAIAPLKHARDHLAGWMKPQARKVYWWCRLRR